MKQAQAQAARAPLNKVWGCQENTPVILIHKQNPEPRIMLDVDRWQHENHAQVELKGLESVPGCLRLRCPGTF